jgi:hypothetical protein
VSTQLRLLHGTGRLGWQLDARTRRIGRQGVARAREQLARAVKAETSEAQPDKLTKAG